MVAEDCPRKIIASPVTRWLMENVEDDEGTGGRRLKVVRLIDEYDLESVGAELERRWTTSGDDGMSLRALAAYFNRRLLEEAMADAGMQPLSGDVESLYEVLTSDDASSAERTRTTRRLEREGIDVAELQTDFVTYQAVRTYLKEHRDAEHASDDRDRTSIETENIQKLRGRTAAVTESKLEQLRDSNHLTLGEFRLFVDVTVFCEDCGQQYEVDELLEQGGCDCSDETGADSQRE